MKLSASTPILTLPILSLLAAVAISPQAIAPRPLTGTLQCAARDCPLLKGPPQTAGMRSGFVRLKPGATVGWHSTGKNEETLVIVHGQGEVLIDAQEKEAFAAPAYAYIPPATRHNVTNTGKEMLDYVYVVAPAKQP